MGEKKNTKRCFRKKESFDISFIKNDVKLIFNKTEIITYSKNILGTKLWFVMSFEDEFIEMKFDYMLKCANMKMNENKKELLNNLAKYITCKILREKNMSIK